MPATTKGFRYPAGSEAAETLDTAIQNLAEDVDDSPGIKAYTTAQRDALAGGQLWAGRVIWNVTLGEIQQYDGAVWSELGGGITDHGALTGLADNDHPQYALDAATTAALAAKQALSDHDLFVGARVTHSAAQTITTGTDTTLSWDTEVFDSTAVHDAGANTRLTVPTGKGGKWLVVCNGTIETSATGVRGLSIKKNGVKVADWLGAASPSYGIRMLVSTIVAAVATDYFEASIYHEHGSDRNTDNDGTRHHFECVFLGA